MFPLTLLNKSNQGRIDLKATTTTRTVWNIAFDDHYHQYWSLPSTCGTWW